MPHTFKVNLTDVCDLAFVVACAHMLTDGPCPNVDGGTSVHARQSSDPASSAAAPARPARRAYIEKPFPKIPSTARWICRA